MKPSPFYPSKPWPITNITNHPAYARLRKSGEDDDSSAAVFYDIAAFATLVKGDPDRYRAGAPLSELANLCRSAKSYEGVICQLVRMNVIRIDTDADEPRMVPCLALEADEISEKRKMVSYYLTERIISFVKTEATRRGITMSKVVEAAIAGWDRDAEID